MLFSRFQLFSLFFGIVFIFIYKDSLLLFCFGKVTKGEYVGYEVYRFNNNHNHKYYYFKNTEPNNQYYKPKVMFTVQKKQYFFETTSNVDYYIGKKVKVIYLDYPPKIMKEHSFMGLWFEGILWLLVPTAILISLFAGLMTKEEIIYINFKKKPYFRKMKRIEFDIIRKAEFDFESENSKANEEIE